MKRLLLHVEIDSITGMSGEQRWLDQDQLSVGVFSTWSITRMLKGSFRASSLSPSCSCIAVNIEGEPSVDQFTSKSQKPLSSVRSTTGRLSLNVWPDSRSANPAMEIARQAT